MSLDPTTIGRYRVLGTLGEGAMGVVYLAEDPLLKRGVAIKVVRGAALSRRDGLRRFQREAEISARLNHPNIVTVFDVGEEPGVGPFIAMEHVEGESLRDRLRRGPLVPEEVLAILGQLRSGLESAHRADIVHRDVKPENLLITPEGRLKLMDFGIAKDDDLAITATAAYLGTPAYAAPELLAGGRASAATDHWAFAVTAFECISGVAPFPGETISATLFLIAHEAPRFPEGMAPALKGLFLRAFDKAPLNRHPDLGAFMDELVEALPMEAENRTRARLQLNANTPSVPVMQALPTIESVEETASRRKFWMAGGLALLLGIGVTWFGFGTTKRILTVISDPPGALVLADGKPVGETPLREIRLPGGTHRLRLLKEGFIPYDSDLEPEQHELRVRLRAAPYRIRVMSDPMGAAVFLDGNPVGETPLVDLAVQGEGAHNLKLEKTGFVSWSSPVKREQALPEIIHLQRVAPHKGATHRTKPEEESKTKKFFKNLFKRKKA